LAKKVDTRERSILRASDVAKMFGVSTRTVQRWIEDGLWDKFDVKPYFTPGGEARFDLDEIKTAIQKSRIRGEKPLRDQLVALTLFGDPHVIVIANNKGGVGKTTVSVNLSAALAEKGYRVLLVDMDPQGNSTAHIGYSNRPAQVDRGFEQFDHVVSDAWEVVPGEGSIRLQEALLSTGSPNLFLLPIDESGLRVDHAVTYTMLKIANGEVAASSHELQRVVQRFYRTFRERLSELLSVEKFDYVLVDTAPTLGPLTTAGLLAARYYIVPVEPEWFSTQGMQMFEQLVSEMMLTQNHFVEPIGYLINNRGIHSNMKRQMGEFIRSYVGDKIFTAELPQDKNFGEASYIGKSILDHSSGSAGSEKIREFANEVISRIDFMATENQR
jgi:chromosome partitioning protein